MKKSLKEVMNLSGDLQNVEMDNSEEDKIEKVKQNEIHDLLFSRELGWQEIIYDLINTEQLDPWDVNITILTNRYLEKIKKLEEADFFVSSKVLLAAALLLRIKSEILLNEYVKSIDEILFGKKEESKKEVEKIELDGEIPELVPKTPVPRSKKVTLKELVTALNKAIKTENRRIRKEIVNKNALRETGISLPKKKKTSIKDRIKDIYDRLFGHFEKNKEHKKVSFTEFIGEDKETRIISFYPLLHLENQKKIWLEQENHFEEIHIWLKEVYLKHNPSITEILAEELKKEREKLNKSQKKRLKKIDKEFKNPIGE